MYRNNDSKDTEKIINTLNEKTEEIIETLKVFLPIFVENLVFESLGSKKLEACLSETNFKENSLIVQVFATFLYAKLNLSGFVKRLRKLFNSVPKEKFFITFFFVNITSIYFTQFNLKDSDKRALEDLVIDIYIDFIAKIKGKKQKGQYKSTLLRKIRNDRSKSRIA